MQFTGNSSPPILVWLTWSRLPFLLVALTAGASPLASLLQPQSFSIAVPIHWVTVINVVCLRPDVGYVQGMSYLAGMLLLYNDTYNTFVCFSNLLNNHFLISLFKMDIKQVWTNSPLPCGSSSWLPLINQRVELPNGFKNGLFRTCSRERFKKMRRLVAFASSWHVCLFSLSEPPLPRSTTTPVYSWTIQHLLK